MTARKYHLAGCPAVAADPGECTCPPVQAEPPRRGALVRDRDGDLWRRGNTRWSCLADVDGVRVRQAARLPWHALVRMYGPLTVVDPKPSR